MLLADVASGLTLREASKKQYFSYAKGRKLSEKIHAILGSKNLAQAVLIAYSFGFLSLPAEDGTVITTLPLTTQE